MSESKSAKPVRSRRVSRELALKGVYQLLLGAASVQDITADLREDEDYVKADVDYFNELLQGVAANLSDLDLRLQPLLDRALAELSPIEHGVLCIAAFELIHDPSIPYRVAINEGVELAKRYGGTDGHKFVNGVLDKLAAAVRPDEFRERRR